MTVWHLMLYSCTHMATVGVKGIMFSAELKSVTLINRACRCALFHRYSPGRRHSLIDLLWLTSQYTHCTARLTSRSGITEWDTHEKWWNHGKLHQNH